MFALVAARCTSSTWLARLPGLRLAWRAHKVSKAFKVKSDRLVLLELPAILVLRAFKVSRVSKAQLDLPVPKVPKVTLVL